LGGCLEDAEPGIAPRDALEGDIGQVLEDGVALLFVNEDENDVGEDRDKGVELTVEPVGVVDEVVREEFQELDGVRVLDILGGNGAIEDLADGVALIHSHLLSQVRDCGKRRADLVLLLLEHHTDGVEVYELLDAQLIGADVRERVDPRLLLGREDRLGLKGAQGLQEHVNLGLDGAQGVAPLDTCVEGAVVEFLGVALALDTVQHDVHIVRAVLTVRHSVQLGGKFVFAVADAVALRLKGDTLRLGSPRRPRKRHHLNSHNAWRLGLNFCGCRRAGTLVVPSLLTGRALHLKGRRKEERRDAFFSDAGMINMSGAQPLINFFI